MRLNCVLVLHREQRTNNSYRMLRFESFVFTPEGGVFPEKLGGGVRPASQNPYPIYDQDLRYSVTYL